MIPYEPMHSTVWFTARILQPIHTPTPCLEHLWGRISLFMWHFSSLAKFGLLPAIPSHFLFTVCVLSSQKRYKVSCFKHCMYLWEFLKYERIWWWTCSSSALITVLTNMMRRKLCSINRIAMISLQGVESTTCLRKSENGTWHTSPRTDIYKICT